jgi:hypothetical protein
MKICFFGNQGNKNFRQAICCLKRGHKVILVIFEGREGKRADPKDIDHSIKKEYPEWILPVKDKPESSFYHWIAQEFDIVVVAGNLAARYAAQIDPNKIPIVLATTGPTNIGIPDKLRGKEFAYRDKSITVQNADAILTAQPWTASWLKDLGLLKKTHFQRPIIDTAEIVNAVDQNFLSQLCDTYKKYKIIFGWFSRSIIDPQHQSYKATEVFIQAAKSFIENRPDSNLRIIYGCHGPDSQKVSNFIKEEGLEDWIDSGRPETPILRFSGADA